MDIAIGRRGRARWWRPRCGERELHAVTGQLSFVSAPDFETPTDAGADNVYDALDHFVDSVLNDTEPMCGPKAARDTLEITLAALQSARENRVVELPLPVTGAS